MKQSVIQEYSNLQSLIKTKIYFINSLKFHHSFQALCGSRVDVPTLNGERLVINLFDEIVKPSTVKRIAGKGLPLSKDPSRKGDMLISFEIIFPEKLNGSTKDLLRSSLPNKWISIVCQFLQEDNHRKLLKYDMLHVNVPNTCLIYYDLC